jgi:hypothetical protein
MPFVEAALALADLLTLTVAGVASLPSRSFEPSTPHWFSMTLARGSDQGLCVVEYGLTSPLKACS